MILRIKDVVHGWRIKKTSWYRWEGYPEKYLRNSFFLFLIFLTFFVYWKFSHIIINTMCPGDMSFYKYSLCTGKFNLYNYSATGYYTRLTEAFLHGQLSFLETPDPSFLNLKDPYDPKFNIESPYRLHDASLYKGKWYVYFGVMPVFLLWIPAKAFGFAMTEPLATTLFCFGGLLSSLGFIYNIARANKININDYYWVMIILLISFSNGIPIMIKRSFAYEVAISSAYFCFMLSIYFYSFTFLKKNNLNKFIIMSSFFFSLSILSRISYILFFTTFFLIEFFCKRNNFRSFLKNQFLFITFPFLAVIIHGLYNYYRFDSFFNFGFEHQIAGIEYNILKYKESILVLYDFFTRVIKFFSYEIGIFHISPFILFLIYPIVLFFFRKDDIIKIIIIFIISSLIQIVSLTLLIHILCIRYALDIFPLLLLAAILSFLFLKENFKNNHYILPFAIFLTLYGCTINFISFPL